MGGRQTKLMPKRKRGGPCHLHSLAGEAAVKKDTLQTRAVIPNREKKRL